MPAKTQLHVMVLRQTAKAVLVTPYPAGGEEAWLPLSRIELVHQMDVPGHAIVQVPDAMAREKGLIAAPPAPIPAGGLILVYDTETTGFPLYRDPSDDPRQPHLVQLAAALYTPAGERVEGFCEIVKPAGWWIQPEAQAVHGISHDRAEAEGVPEAEALLAFDNLWSRAALRVAHNEPFDARILRIAYLRYRDRKIADAWKAAPAECTQKLATPVCRVPPSAKMKAVGRHHFKTASLEDAVRILLGETMVDAHDASADLDYCARVFFHLKGASGESPEIPPEIAPKPGISGGTPSRGQNEPPQHPDIPSEFPETLFD